VCRAVLNPARPLFREARYILAEEPDIQHDAGLITHETEAFKKNRPAYRIAEPLLTFYHAIMRPAWEDLERPGRAPRSGGARSTRSTAT
jgi:uncharacterized protein